ncbi:MAG: hypothetical protein AB7Q01_11920 [Gammaproteobacteria bacterium]
MKGIGAMTVIACVLALAACGPSESDMKARGMAERYYRLIQQDQFAEAVKFFPEKDRALWLDALQQNRQKLGPLQSFQISAEEQNTVYSGKFYIFTVDTQYELSQELETLTLKTWVSANDSLSIVSHQIDAD